MPSLAVVAAASPAARNVDKYARRIKLCSGLHVTVWKAPAATSVASLATEPAMEAKIGCGERNLSIAYLQLLCYRKFAVVLPLV
jgi:hypothetical protein